MNWFPVGSFAGIVKVAVNVPSLATVGLTRGLSPAELMEILTVFPGVHPLPLTVTTVPDDPDVGLTVIKFVQGGSNVGADVTVKGAWPV